MADELEQTLAAVEAANPVEQPEAEPAQDEPLDLTEEAPEKPEETQPEDSPDTEETESEEAARRRGRSKPLIERVAELTAEKHQLRRELEELRAKSQKTEPVEPTAPPEKPDPANFEFGDADPAYYDALTEWRIETRLAEREQQATERREHEAFNEQLRAGMESAEAKGREKYADFEDRIAEAVEARGGEPLPPLLATAISISPVGGDIAYKLATDPEASARLERLSKDGATAKAMALAFGEMEGEHIADDDSDLDLEDQLDMARMLGRMKARLKGRSAPAAEPAEIAVTKAPEPPAQRAKGSGGRTRVTADTTDTAAFMRDYGKDLGLN